MQHKSWLILISVLLLSMTGGLPSSSVTVNAHQIHRAQRVDSYRGHYSRHPQRKINAYRTRIPANVYPKDLLYYTANNQTGFTNEYFKNRHYQTHMSKNYIHSVIKSEYHAINQARHSIREGSLSQSHELINLANWRAKQANRHFTHYNQKGQPLAWLDAHRMRLGSYRYNRQNIGENMFFVGKLSQIQTGHGLAGYYFKDPKALAADNVFDSLNNDAASQWSHGENIMMPQHRYIGIGTYYRHANHGLYVLVEFSSKKPVVHRK